MTLSRLLVACAVVAAAVAVTVVAALDADERSFQSWMVQHKRTYAIGSDEYHYRLSVFRETLARIADRRAVQLRSGAVSLSPSVENESAVRWGTNSLSDRTDSEFRALLTFKPPQPTSDEIPNFELSDVTDSADPVSYDWRDHGAISAVKDQGQCGSCWAFSATETLESFWFLKNGTLPILGPQQIVDCDLISLGCQGGATQFAYEYLMRAGGLDTEDAYPYESGDSGTRGFCMFSPASIGARVQNWTYATPVCADFSCNHQDEPRMESALVANGPVSVCLNANAWQDYTGGVMTSSDCGPNGLLSLDHCVQAVGYNKHNATAPYWIVRNSWNTDWGDAGYIYLQMGENTCGVTNIATQVTVKLFDD